MEVKFKNLRGEMARAGMTQTKLAQTIGKTNATVGYKLRGEVAWTLKEMESIQKILTSELGTTYSLDFLFKE